MATSDICVTKLVETSTLPKIGSSVSPFLTGVTDGSSPAAGEVGEVLTVEFPTTVRSNNAAANVYVDTPQTMTVTPGVWMVGFNLAVGYVLGPATNTVLSGKMVMRTAGNVEVLQSTMYLQWNGQASNASNQIQVVHAARQFPITLTANETYKMSIQDNRASTLEYFTIEGNTLSGGIPNPDNYSGMYAVRIA